MTLPILPTAPSRTDPTNFSVEADAWVAALGPWTDAANAMEASLQTSNLVGTSTTSLAVGTGSKGFTTQAGKAWIVGSYVFIVATSDRSRVMQGKVTAYNSGTGSLVVDVNISSGSGTYSSWDVGIANPSIGATTGANLAGTLQLTGTGANPSNVVLTRSDGATDAKNWYLQVNNSHHFCIGRLDDNSAIISTPFKIDTSSNIGISVTPNSWHTTAKAIQMQSAGALWNYSNNQLNLTQGLYYDSGGFKYTNTSVAVCTISMNSGEFYFQQAGAGTAGGTPTLTTPLVIDAAGTIGMSIVPSAWNSTIKAIDISTGMSLFYSTSGSVSSYGTNIYLNGSSNYIRKVTGYAAMYQQNVSDGSHVFYSAGTGTAGTTIASWTPTLKLDASGNALVTSNGGFGYGAGSGGTVTQSTNKSTGVTLNKVSGQITMNAAALASNTSVTFLVTNSTVLASDNIIVNLKGGYASYGTYDIKAEGIGAGSFVITLKNISGGSLSEAVVLTFSVIRGSTT